VQRKEDKDQTPVTAETNSDAGSEEDETHLDAHERVDLDAVAVEKRQEAVRRRHRRGGAGLGAGREHPAALHVARLQKGAVPLHDQARARFLGTKQSPTTGFVGGEVAERRVPRLLHRARQSAEQRRRRVV
jgi:hypothetical protein